MGSFLDYMFNDGLGLFCFIFFYILLGGGGGAWFLYLGQTEKEETMNYWTFSILGLFLVIGWCCILQPLFYWVLYNKYRHSKLEERLAFMKPNEWE